MEVREVQETVSLPEEVPQEVSQEHRLLEDLGLRVLQEQMAHGTVPSVRVVVAAQGVLVNLGESHAILLRLVGRDPTTLVICPSMDQETLHQWMAQQVLSMSDPAEREEPKQHR
jgi:hypothetical protein